MKPIQLTLFYGYVESDDGIHHAFELTGPKDNPDLGAVAERLAATLCTTVDDPLFNYNIMNLTAPTGLQMIDRKETPTA